MSNNPSASGRNTFGGLPRVGPGDPIKPSVINRIAEAVDKRTPTFGANSRVTSTPNGTIVDWSAVENVYHPWKCFNRGDLLFITLGQFYWDSSLAGGVQLSTNASALGGGVNAWLFNTSHPWAMLSYGENYSQYPSPGGYHLGGAEIWFDDDKCNYLTNKQIYYGMDPLHTEFRVGLYYIEVAAWSGRQMTAPYSGSGLNAMQLAANQVAVVFNEYSLKMKGRIVPLMRYAKQEDMAKKKTLMYPICTVDENFSIFPGIRSDIFHIGSSFQPLRVYLASNNSTWSFAVTPGTVNRMPPKLNGDYIDKAERPTKTFSTEGYVCVKASYEPDSFFPKISEIVFVTTIPPDSSSNSHYPLAKINGNSTQGFTVTDLSIGNLYLNRLKAGNNDAVWTWGVV